MSCQIMGIVNVTPDSFSDGGLHADADAAIAHGLRLRADGAHLLDVGGESTRPGAVRVPVAQEQERVLPVIAALAGHGAIVSVDTMNASTAAAAIDAGARIVNDVSGGLADPEMFAAVAASGAALVLGHWRGHSDDMYRRASYDDVAGEVAGELLERVASAEAAGIPRSRLILDPGIGFGKRGPQNWETLRALPRLVALDLRVLIGTSRKRFLGEVLSGDADLSRADAATAVTSALAAREGAWAVRVHNVAATRDALSIQEAWSADQPGSGTSRAPRATRAGAATAETPRTDRITLTGVRGFGYHGVFEHEKREGQEFVVDAEITLDTSRAAASDDVADTVHYGELAEQIVGVIEGTPVDLVERLAQRIADAVLQHPLVDAVRITLHKPHAPITVPFTDVTVTIERSRG